MQLITVTVLHSYTVMCSDYFVSRNSMSFAAQAINGEESCISHCDKLCDNEVERPEVAVVQIILTEMFTLYVSGNGMFIQTDVTIV